MFDEPAREIGEVLGESRYGQIVRVGSDLHVTLRATSGSRTSVYVENEAGSDEAWDAYLSAVRRGRLARSLNALLAVAVVSAAVWILTLTVGTVGAAVALTHSSDNYQQWSILSVVLQIDQLASAVFISSTAVYALVWLYRRGIPNKTR